MRRSAKIFNCICFIALALFLLSIALVVSTRTIVEHFGINNNYTRTILDLTSFKVKKNRLPRYNIDWASIYPFPKSIETDDSLVKKTSLFESIAKKIAGVKNGVKFYTTDYLVFYKKFSKLARFYENAVLWNYTDSSEYNGIVRGHDDEPLSVTRPANDLDSKAKAAAELSDFCHKLGVGYLYVNAPGKTCKYDDLDVSNIIDYSNQNADNFLSLLSTNNVKNYDLREKLHEEGYNHHELFYHLDPHWVTKTGLWASRQISSFLNEDHGFSIDLSLLNPSAFTTTVYPKCFLGGLGKKLLINVVPNDYELIAPRYQTSLHYNVKSMGIDADGDFSLLYDVSFLPPDYIYGNQPLEIIENKLIENDSHILIVHDSFGNCVVPFLSLGARRTDSIDLRYFTGSLHNYIETERPDVVITMYSTIMYVDPLLFDFR